MASRSVEYRKKFGDIFYLIAGAIVAYAIYTFLGFLFNTPTPIVAVMTESMIPTIYPGDAVVVYNHGEIKEGDIIVFDGGKMGCRDKTGKILNAPIIHRVVKINKDGTFTTKGDNIITNPISMECERHIPRKYVYGKAVLKLPFIGWPKKLLTDALNYIFLSSAR